MDGSVVALVALVVLAAGVLLLPLWGARRRKGLKSLVARYETIADALLGQDFARAREELKEIIRADTDDVGAYLRLARIFRLEGRRDRAIAIHRSLTAREVPDRALREQVLTGLIEDLIHLDRPGEAQAPADALRLIDRRSPLLSRIELHRALEQEDWEAARHALGSLRRANALANPSEAEQVRTWIAERLAAAGRTDEALKLLDEVLRERADYVPAALLSGDLSNEQGEFERAARVWTELLRSRTEAASHLIPRLEKVYFELGRFSDLERLYAQVAATEKPGAAAVRLALARLALRKGEAKTALAFIEESLQRDPEDAESRRWRLYLQMEAGRADEARRSLKQELEDGLGRAGERRCPYCRASLEPSAVRCPECRHWFPNSLGATPSASRPV